MAGINQKLSRNAGVWRFAKDRDQKLMRVGMYGSLQGEVSPTVLYVLRRRKNDVQSFSLIDMNSYCVSHDDTDTSVLPFD